MPAQQIPLAVKLTHQNSGVAPPKCPVDNRGHAQLIWSQTHQGPGQSVIPGFNELPRSLVKIHCGEPP